MRGQLKELWKEAKSPIDFIIVIWIYGLIGLASIGMISLLYGIFTGKASI